MGLILVNMVVSMNRVPKRFFLWKLISLKLSFSSPKEPYSGTDYKPYGHIDYQVCKGRDKNYICIGNKSTNLKNYCILWIDVVKKFASKMIWLNNVFLKNQNNLYHKKSIWRSDFCTFWQDGTVSINKIQYFFELADCWSFFKIFVLLPWKLDNPYCHNELSAFHYLLNVKDY